MASPLICLGQQPCGFFPRRFLCAKITAARRLRGQLGGGAEIVLFFHDSDHDPRETTTILADQRTGREARLNFAFANATQKKFSPLHAKRVLPEWHANTARQLPQFAPSAAVEAFRETRAGNVADFCLEMYRRLGWLEGVRVVRSSDPEVRRRAARVEDCFVDVPHEGELVRARRRPDGSLALHKGGAEWIELPPQETRPEQVSPTRDTRWAWMRSVIPCTHYVAGRGEIQYLDPAAAREAEIVPRDEVADADRAEPCPCDHATA